MNKNDMSKWLKRYEGEGITGLLDRPRSGRPAKITSSHIRLILAAIEKVLVYTDTIVLIEAVIY